MSKIFFDTEFLEGTQSKEFLGIKYGEIKPTIDLISIGLVTEDLNIDTGNGIVKERSLYLISKDFNLKEAWNRHDVIEANSSKNHTMNDIKVYWLRDNVLLPIWLELVSKEQGWNHQLLLDNVSDIQPLGKNMTYRDLYRLIQKYGKTNKQIAEEIINFVELDKTKPEFYGYYADYDWVVFCWLFGKMIDLPKGFPMYCKDLKQIADEIWEKTGKNTKFESPKNEHNALSDAKWNKELHKFLTNL